MDKPHDFCNSVEMDSMRKQSELDKKSYDDLLRERDILSKVSGASISVTSCTMESELPPSSILYICIHRDCAKLRAPQRKCSTLSR